MKMVLFIKMDREKLHGSKNKHTQKVSPNSIFIDPAKSLFYMEKANLSGAGNEIRTRDSKLGKLALYQLSYARPRNAIIYDRFLLMSIVFGVLHKVNAFMI